MTKMLILACLVAMALARPQAPKEPVAILSQDSSVDIDGTFQYSFETADGTKAQQSGQLKTIGADQGNSVTGSFSYIGADGETYSITYTADENGYQPQGAHLAALPEAIARSIEYNKAHPEEDKSQ